MGVATYVYMHGQAIVNAVNALRWRGAHNATVCAKKNEFGYVGNLSSLNGDWARNCFTRVPCVIVATSCLCF